MKLAERFLQLYALAHLVGGLLLPWMVGTAIFTDYNRALAQAFHVSDDAALAQARFLTGLMGPTVASWGLLFLLLVRQAFRHPDRQLWWGMVLAGLVWAPYDSFLSWQNGIFLNVVINLLSLAALLVPLWLVRHNFLNTPPANTR